MRPRGVREATIVLLGATALTIALTYPVAFDISHVGRVNTDDGRLSIWNVAWVAHALTTDPQRLYHANIFYPHPYALAFSEANLGAGVLGAPIWLATKNPHTTHNVVLLACFVLAFAGAYYLTRYLSQSRPAAWLAGILFAFCPYIFARTAHIQLMFIGWLPFCLLAFHRVVDRPTLGRSLALGVVMWGTALSCAYYGIFAALMIGIGTLVFAVSRALWRSGTYWGSIGLAAFTSAGLTLPFFLPYTYVQREGFARTLNDARAYSADLGAWGASAAWAHRWWLDWVGGFKEVLFPGVLVTVLAAVGVGVLWRQSRDVATLYLLIAALAFWSAFGPDAGLYRVFYETIPVFSFLRAPARMGLMVTLALVVFASAGAAYLFTRTQRPIVTAALLAALAVAELSTMPLTQFREVEPVSPVYRLLANLPRGPVVEFPFWYRRSDFPRHAYYMLNSTAHWQPLVNGYSDHIPARFRDSVVPLSTFPSRVAFRVLVSTGARYVVFHLDMYDARLRARLMEGLKTYAAYLRPLAQEESVWLYEIVAWPN